MRTGLIVLCGAVTAWAVGVLTCAIMYIVDVIRRYLRCK